MINKVKVILNPLGGRLNQQDKINILEQALRQVGLQYDLELTAYPGHGIEVARHAAQEGWAVVAAAGGDGLVNQVLNGLIQAAGQGEAGILGIIPLGTANDLADALGLPENPLAACQRIAAGQTRLIDVGQVNNRCFANNSAVGLEPVITMEHERIRFVKGKVRYLLAALRGIINAKPWQMRISWDHSQYEGPVTLVSVGNARRTGGSFYMTPQASLDDGLIDFIYAAGMARWQMLQLFPHTLKGTHIHHPLVVYKRTTALSITCLHPTTPIQADGEIIDRHATQIDYRLIPGKLRVIG